MDSPSLNIRTLRHLDILVVYWVPKKTHFVNEDFRDLRDSSISVGVITQKFHPPFLPSRPHTTLRTCVFLH